MTQPAQPHLMTLKPYSLFDPKSRLTSLLTCILLSRIMIPAHTHTCLLKSQHPVQISFPRYLFQEASQESNGFLKGFPTSTSLNTLDHTRAPVVVCLVLVMSHPSGPICSSNRHVFPLWEVKIKEASTPQCGGPGLPYHASQGALQMESQSTEVDRLWCWLSLHAGVNQMLSHDPSWPGGLNWGLSTQASHCLWTLDGQQQQ